jgi:phosphoenolpyruvate synthase/pyruvate phosphate dikinase
MGYVHIFTDGVDKLLSASVWFEWYGGKDAFCFYEKNALRGYIHTQEYKRLTQLGSDLFRKPTFISKLYTTAKALTDEVEDVHKKLAYKHIDDIGLLSHVSTLLKEAYRNYFYTEEYYTNALDLTKDASLIESVGKFRYEFINTCIKATEGMHLLAHRIVGKEAEFYTIDEVLEQKSGIDIDKRKQSFLLTQKNHKLDLTSGNNARDLYDSLFHQEASTNLKKLSGLGASKGNVKGPVYLISLASLTLSEQIEAMPQGSILVTESTQPDMILACNKAVAIIADEGGVLSHAAIISRELGIPCVVGTRNATRVLKNFDVVMVDGEAGEVTICNS